jgi:hypothetical protein
MPAAGFYSIHTDELKFAADGRWYADGEPILHERLALLFSRNLRRKATGGFEIRIDDRYHADIVVEDTPFVVVDVDLDEPATVTLNDGSREPLAADSLATGDDNVLYCTVRNGTESARFLRSAWNRLAPHIEETDADGGYALRIGERSHIIRKRP